MKDRHQALWNAVEQSVLQGGAKTPSSLRQAAAGRGELPAPLAALVDKIHRHAYRVTDEDLASLRAHYNEDELFEIIVAAAFGAATTRLQAGLRALEEA
jgi:alkylhydroperoxidase family enzyme